MKHDPIYLVTLIESIPVLVKCESSEDVHKLTYKNKRYQLIGETCAKMNIASGNWTQEVNSDRIANMINKRLPHLDCWIQKRDALL